MKEVFFLGCGKMGSVLARNLVAENSFRAAQITVLKQSAKNKIDGLNYIKNAAALPQNYRVDLVFIAVKPQDAQEILTDFAKQKFLHSKTIFVSILAGKKIEFFERIFGKKAKIIRSMPNLPIQYSQGIFPYFANKNILASELKNLAKIFDKFGSAFELSDEKLFDAATAIFGSGPAYIFLLQEIFAEIAVNLGIAENQAPKLVKKLFLGSALMSEFSKNNFAELRESVTSKGGTTEAALEILQKKSSLKNIFKQAIDAARTKSEELSKT